MAYGVKYRTSYKRRSNNTTTIDILENGYSGSITTLDADANPLEITLDGDIENIYMATRGSGANINLFVTPLTLHKDFFVEDPQKYIVKVYNSTGATNLYWQGYVNTNIYNEDYSVADKTSITVQCSDGMSLLDNIPYEVNSTTHFSGFSTVATVISNILSKIGLMFDEIITSSDLRITGTTSNLFTGLTINNENYYDENGVPMSCRQVLNSIFQPLGLVVTFRGSKIYIIDPFNLRTTSKGKSYDINGTSEADYSLGGYLDISNDDIRYYVTGQNFDVVKSFNSIDIKYNPYSFTKISYDFNATGNATVNNAWNQILLQDDLGNFKCYYTTGVTMAGWSGNSFVGIYYSGEQPQYYLMLKPNSTTGYSVFTFPFNVNQDEDVELELSFDVWVGTVSTYNPFKSGSDTKYHNGTTYVNYPAEVDINRFFCHNFFIKMNNYYFVNTTYDPIYGTYTWKLAHTPDVPYHYCPIRFIKSMDDWKNSNISNTWINIKEIISIAENAGVYNERNGDRIWGSVTLIIDSIPQLSAVVPDNESSIKSIFIKNLTIRPVDKKGNELTNDGVLTKSIISNYNTIRKDTLDIELTNSIGIYGTSKGAFSSNAISPAGINLSGLMRSGSTTLYDTTELLAQSLLSQYKTPRIKLNVNLDVEDYLLSIENKLIKDTDYMESKAFYIINGIYNDKQESLDCSMIEIAESRETIS